MPKDLIRTAFALWGTTIVVGCALAAKFRSDDHGFHDLFSSCLSVTLGVLVMLQARFALSLDPSSTQAEMAFQIATTGVLHVINWNMEDAWCVLGGTIEAMTSVLQMVSLIAINVDMWLAARELKRRPRTVLVSPRSYHVMITLLVSMLLCGVTVFKHPFGATDMGCYSRVLADSGYARWMVLFGPGLALVVSSVAAFVEVRRTRCKFNYPKRFFPLWVAGSFAVTWGAAFAHRFYESYATANPDDAAHKGLMAWQGYTEGYFNALINLGFLYYGSCFVWCWSDELTLTDEQEAGLLSCWESAYEGTTSCRMSLRWVVNSVLCQLRLKRCRDKCRRGCPCAPSVAAGDAAGDAAWDSDSSGEDDDRLSFSDRNSFASGHGGFDVVGSINA